MSHGNRKRSGRVRTGALIAAAVSGIVAASGCGSSPAPDTAKGTNPGEPAAGAQAFTPKPPELNQAVDHHKAGRHQQAIELYTQAIGKSPRCPEAFNWRGSAYDDIGESDKALADLNQAISLSPCYADAYNNRGELHRRLGNVDQARADYERALKCDKGLTSAQENLASVGGPTSDGSSSSSHRHTSVIFLPGGGLNPGPSAAAPTSAAVAPSSGTQRSGFGQSAAPHSSAAS